MINCVINLPTISSQLLDILKFVRADCGASRTSGGVERSSERELQKNDGAERSGLNYRNRWSAKRLFRCSHSAHMPWCVAGAYVRQFNQILSLCSDAVISHTARNNVVILCSY